MVKCQHVKTRALYEQRPPSEGRKLQAVADKCEACGHIEPRNIKEADR